jgi:DUF1707 SHOCT-like domain/Domain of unknown function (DUF4190)
MTSGGPGYGGTAYGGPGHGPRPYGGMAYGGPAGMRTQMRATDADRERVAGLLNQAFTEGRLTRDEHDARLGRALSAVTYADLDACLADLMPPPTYVPGRVKTNVPAIISLICAIAQVTVVLWPVMAVCAVVLGHVGRRQIKRTGENGAGIALAGLILGWIGTAVLLLIILAVVLLAVASTTTSGHTVPRH